MSAFHLLWFFPLSFLLGYMVRDFIQNERDCRKALREADEAYERAMKKLSEASAQVMCTHPQPAGEPFFWAGFCQRRRQVHADGECAG